TSCRGRRIRPGQSERPPRSRSRRKGNGSKASLHLRLPAKNKGKLKNRIAKRSCGVAILSVGRVAKAIVKNNENYRSSRFYCYIACDFVWLVTNNRLSAQSAMVLSVLFGTAAGVDRHRESMSRIPRSAAYRGYDNSASGSSGLSRPGERSTPGRRNPPHC